MKEEIEDLLRTYNRRAEDLKTLHEQANDNLTKVRLAAKRMVYMDVISDLKHLLESNEEDSPR